MICLRELLKFLIPIGKYFRLHNATFHQKIMTLHMSSFFQNDCTLNVQTVLTDKGIIIY